MRLAVKIATVVVIIAIIVAATAGYYYTSRQPASQKVTVMLDFIPIGQHVPLYAGVNEGIFAKYGLDVTILPSPGGGLDTVRALAAGKVDFVLDDPGTLMLASYRDNITNVRIVSSYFRHGPEGVIYVAGRGITQPKDLEGKTLGAFVGSSTEALFTCFAHTTGIDLSKIKFEHLAPSALGVALLQGRVDGALLYTRAVADLTPQATKEGLKVTAFAYKDYGCDAYGLGVVTRTDIIEKDPGLVTRFIKGFWESVQYTLRNPDEAVKSFLKYNAQSNYNLTMAEWNWAFTNNIGGKDQILGANDVLTLGWIDPSRISSVGSLMTDAYKIPQQRLTPVYTNQFVKQS